MKNQKIRGVELISGVEAAKLSLDELRKLTKPIFKTARQRAERMMKSEAIKTSYSPALREAQRSRSRGQVSLFESKGKDRNELLMEYARARRFLEDETSSVKGTRKYMKSVKEALSKQIDMEGLDEKDTMDMLKIFNQLENNNAWIANQRFKYEVFEAINEEMQKDSKASMHEIKTNVEKLLEDIYLANIEGDDFYEIF